MPDHQTVEKKDFFSLLATALVCFAGILSETSMNVTFPHLSKVFGLGLATLQWITTGYLLAVAITITLGATLAHNWKERTILFTALANFCLGTLIAMLASSFPILMIGRILQGGATGLAIPLLFNLIVERVPKQKIGTYMGLSGMVVSLAPAIGPTYGGFMISRFDWHMIYTFILPVPIISFILGFFFLRNSEKSRKRAFDLLSFLLLASSLVFAIVAISSLEEGHIDWLYLVLCILPLACFIYRSLKIDHPFLDIRILKQPTVLLAILPFFIFQFINLSANFLIPNFLVIEKDISTAQAGFALLPGTMLGAFLSPLFGKLYDRNGPKPTLFTGNSLLFLAVLLLLIFTKELTLTAVIAIYICFTLGRNMAFNNTLALATTQVDKGKTADTTALFQLAQTFAGAIGTAVTAVIANQAPNMTKGTQDVFTLLLGLVLFVFLSYLLLFKRIAAKKL